MIRILKNIVNNLSLKNKTELQRPNLLLTRYPLLFIGKTWGEIPQFLESQGYSVQVTPILPSCSQKVHAFINEEFCPILIQKCIEDEKFKSLRVVTPHLQETKKSVFHWPKDVSITTMKELWLQLVISLAETDLTRQD